MPDIGLEEVPVVKVYNPSTISAATFFGGPLVGSYLIAENFKALGSRRKATITWFVAILLIIFIIAIPQLFPSLSRMPNLPFIVLFTPIAGWTAKIFQSDAIKNHIEKGGNIYTLKRVVLIVLIGIAITVGLALLLFLIQDIVFIYSR